MIAALAMCLGLRQGLGRAIPPWQCDQLDQDVDDVERFEQDSVLVNMFVNRSMGIREGKGLGERQGLKERVSLRGIKRADMKKNK